jgi:hypothetical protein
MYICFLPPLSPTSFRCSLFVLLYPTKAHVAERLEQADANFPRIFRHCTWVLNGTHTPVVLYKSRGERYKDYYSFKTKKASLNTQVCIICIAMYSPRQLGVLPNGTWGYVSGSSPAGSTPDITQLRQSDFQHHLEEHDVTMLE